MPKLIYNVNGASEVHTPPTILYNIGDIIVLSTNIIPRTYYLHKEWNTTSDGTGVSFILGGTLTIGSTDITLYAIWETTDIVVTFNGNGSLEPDIILTTHSPANLKVNFVFNRPNCNHSDWIDSNGTHFTIPYSGSRLDRTYYPWYYATKTETIYAGWTRHACTITYVTNNLSDVRSNDIITYTGVDTKVHIKDNSLIKVGYTFIHWNTKHDDTGIIYKANSYTYLDDDLILYAIYSSSNILLIYNGNGNTGGSTPLVTSIDSAKEILVSTNTFIKENCIFETWNTLPDGRGTSYNINSYIYLNIELTLYAIWKVVTPTLSFNGNGYETGVLPVNIASSATIQIPGNILARSNSIFLGWNTKPNGSGTSYNIYYMGSVWHFSPSELIITEDTILYAIWEDIIVTVTFDGNGATSGLPPSSIVYANTDRSSIGININSFSHTLVKDDYFLYGWDTNPNNDNNIIDYISIGVVGGYNPIAPEYINNNTYIFYYPNVSTTFYAIWRKKAIINLHSNSVGAVIPVIINSIISAVHPYNYSSTYYTPVYTTPSPEGIVISLKTIMGLSIALTNFYEEYYNTVKDGYYITHFNTCPDGSGISYYFNKTNKLVLSIYTSTENINLYAQYTPIVLCTYHYNYVGCNSDRVVEFLRFKLNLRKTGSQDKIFVGMFGDSYLIAKREGYKFSHWNSNPNGTGTSYFDKTSIDSNIDIHLYAQWVITYNLYFSANTSLGYAYIDSEEIYHIYDKDIIFNKVLLSANDIFRVEATFNYWSTTPNDSGLKYYKDELLTITNQNLTLYAIWTNTYTLNYVISTIIPSTLIDAPNITFKEDVITPITLPIYELPLLENGTYDSSSIEEKRYTNNIETSVKIKLLSFNSSIDGSGISYSIGLESNTILPLVNTTDIVPRTEDNSKNIVTRTTTIESNTVRTTNSYIITTITTLVSIMPITSDYQTTVTIHKNRSTNICTIFSKPSTFSLLNTNMTLYAQYDIDHVVYLQYNLGNYEASGELLGVIGSTHILPTTKTNNVLYYPAIFLNWNTKADGSGTTYLEGSQYTITSGSSPFLYAQWDTNCYSVTYYINTDLTSSDTLGNPSVTEYGLCYRGGDLVTIIQGFNSTSNESYSFYGWSTSLTDNTVVYNIGDTFVMPSENINLYQKWKYKPTFFYEFDLSRDSNQYIDLNVGSIKITLPTPIITNYGDTIILTGLHNIDPVFYKVCRVSKWNSTAYRNGSNYIVGEGYQVPNTPLITHSTLLESTLRFTKDIVVDGNPYTIETPLVLSPYDYAVYTNFESNFLINYLRSLSSTTPSIPEASSINKLYFIGDVVIIPPCPTVLIKENYVFIGWSDVIDSSDTIARVRRTLIVDKGSIAKFNVGDTIIMPDYDYIKSCQWGGLDNVDRTNYVMYPVYYYSRPEVRYLLALMYNPFLGVTNLISTTHLEIGATATVSLKGNIFKTGHYFAGWYTNLYPPENGNRYFIIDEGVEYVVPSYDVFFATYWLEYSKLFLEYNLPNIEPEIIYFKPNDIVRIPFPSHTYPNKKFKYWGYRSLQATEDQICYPEDLFNTTLCDTLYAYWDDIDVISDTGIYDIYTVKTT